MKYQSSFLANPSIIYFISWVPLILISRMELFFFSIKGGLVIETFIIYLIFNFFLMYAVCMLIFSKRPHNSSGINNNEIYALRAFTITLFKIWILGFFVNVVFSGGLPLFWVLMGDVRTYSSFGIPTFSGLFNMIRMFIVIASVICAIHKIPTPKYITFVLVLSFCAELNRASILFALLGLVGSFLLFNKLIFKNFFKMTMVVLIFVASFSFIAEFREQGRGHYNDPANYFSADVGQFGAVMYVVLYFLTPLNNLYYQYSLGMEPSYTPYFTFQSLLPTILREKVFDGGKERSVELASEAFNTSPYMANIIADFGLGGGLLVITIIQFLSCYIFIRAARFSLEHTLMHSILWGATLLGVFTNLYFSLIVLAFPLLIAIFSRYKRRYIKYYDL